METILACCQPAWLLSFPHTIHYNLDVYIELKLQSRLNRTLQFSIPARIKPIYYVNGQNKLSHMSRCPVSIGRLENKNISTKFSVTWSHLFDLETDFAVFFSEKRCPPCWNFRGGDCLSNAHWLSFWLRFLA